LVTFDLFALESAVQKRDCPKSFLSFGLKMDLFRLGVDAGPGVLTACCCLLQCRLMTSADRLQPFFFAVALLILGFPVIPAYATAWSLATEAAAAHRRERYRNRAVYDYVDPFNRPGVNDELFKGVYRFWPWDVRLLARTLRLPRIVRTEGYHTAKRRDALLYVLFR
jgi:hypothetical protein